MDQRAGQARDRVQQANRDSVNVRDAFAHIVTDLYVIVASVIELAARAHPERSPAGIALTISSLLVMPLLGWRKRNAAQRCATSSS